MRLSINAMACFLVYSFHTGYVAKIPFWDTQTVELTTGRKLRTSPLYTRMEKDAVFGQTMAYERPLYFMSSKEGFEDGNYNI